MMALLCDLADRIKAAYEDMHGNGVVLVGLKNEPLKMFCYFQSRNDKSEKTLPSYGRIVLMMLGQTERGRGRIRLAFVNDAGAIGDKTQRESFEYDVGEEEQIATNLREFLVDDRPFWHLTGRSYCH